MGSKLGLHGILSGNALTIVRDVQEARGYVASVKALDSPGWLKEVKALDPRVLTVGRFREGVGGADVEAPIMDGDLHQEARRLMDLVLPRWEQHRAYVDVWELFNEFDPIGAEGHRRLAEVTLYCLEIAQREGYRVGVLSYSLGVPEWDEMAAVVDTGLFAAMQAGGHVLCLHEYAWPIDQHFGEGLPGRPAYPDRGPLMCRYRWWYEDFLKPRGQVVPLLITEANIAYDVRAVRAEQWLAAMQWYDQQVCRDDYVLGVHIFGVGMPGGIFPHCDVDPFAAQLTAYLAANTKDQQPPTPSPLPQPAPVALANGSFEGGWTRDTHTGQAFGEIFTPEGWVTFWKEGGPVPHDPTNTNGYGRPEVHVINREAPYLDPPRVRSGHRAVKLFTFYRIHDAGIYQRVRGLTAGDELRFTAWAHAWSSIADDPFHSSVDGDGWRNVSFTVGIDPAGGTDPWAASVVWGPVARLYDQYGQIPEVRAIAQGDAATVFIRSQVLWPFKHCDAYFDDAALTVTPSSPEGSDAREPYERTYHLLPQNATREQAHAILDRIFDSKGTLGWSADDAGIGRGLAKRNVRAYYKDQWPDVPGLEAFFPTYYKGASFQWAETQSGGGDPPQPAEPLYVGFNDPNNEGAGRWMANAGLHGLVVIPISVGNHGGALDFSAYKAAGLRVIVNLRWGWSTDRGGAGTLPRPGTADWERFVEAATFTVNSSAGVWGWEVGNEANNPREWPLDGPLSAAMVAQTYNAIRAGAKAGTRMAPGALDPFNAQAGDPREWLRVIYEDITGEDAGCALGAEFVTAHGYVRGPDPALVGSAARFADWPLTWQYLNYPLCVTRLLQALPSPYQGLPVYVTEFNHLWRTAEGDWGWVDDQRAADVVAAAVAAAQAAGFAGLALYRWAGDEWAVERNGAVLEAVRTALTISGLARRE